MIVGVIIMAVLCKTGRLQYNKHGNSSKKTAAPANGPAPTGTHYPVPGPSERGTHYPSVVQYPQPA